MEKVDLIVKNAKVYTVDSSFNIAESFAIKNGKFISIGSNEEIEEKYISDNIIDLNGKIVYPGFIDPHCHFVGYGLYKQRPNFTGTKSFEEVLEIVKQYAKKYNSEWIIGRGWDQNDWEVKEYPDNKKLDSLFPNRPVILYRIDGHAAIANSEALKIASITIDSKVDGGEFLKKNNQLTGVLIDNAMDMISNIIDDNSDEDIFNALNIAQENCFEVGLTSIYDAGLDRNVIEAIDKMHKSGKLKMRIYAMLSANDENIDFIKEHGIYKTERLNVRSIKLFSDGALGSRGACLIETYSDDTANYGLMVHDDEYFFKYCNIAIKNNYQICTHAIGDSACRYVLKTYGQHLKGKNDRRWRIEHSQVVNENDFPLYKRYSIIPSVQTTHATSDMYWAVDRLGKERIKNAYAYKKLLKQNGWLANGSDFPIESINPLFGFYAGTVRKDQKAFPENGFYPENALTRKEVLKAMTIWAAKSGFEENEKGSIEVGKVADFVVLNEDIMTMDLEKTFKAKVLKTYIGGEQVFPAKKID
ncbi:MAG: amidohydrolase family protein [Bacteroidota bacterium]|nr:amidohydrolase family protein [Bacteroidota bacterium]